MLQTISTLSWNVIKRQCECFMKINIAAEREIALWEIYMEWYNLTRHFGHSKRLQQLILRFLKWSWRDRNGWGGGLRGVVMEITGNRKRSVPWPRSRKRRCHNLETVYSANGGRLKTARFSLGKFSCLVEISINVNVSESAVVKSAKPLTVSLTRSNPPSARIFYHNGHFHANVRR